MAKIKLDLHDIFNQGRSIDAELNRVIREAIDTGDSFGGNYSGQGQRTIKKTRFTVFGTKTY